MIKLNLGTILIPRDIWERARKSGFDREAIREIIIGNGEDSLYSQLDTTMFCTKCGLAGTQGTQNDCEHDWDQK